MLPVRSLEGQQPSLSKDGLECCHSPDPLALYHLLFFPYSEHVVEHDQERSRQSLSGPSRVFLNQVGLRLLEKSDQVFVWKVTTTPDHEDATILELPLEVLHGRLLCVTEPSLPLKCQLCLPHSHWTLVK